MVWKPHVTVAAIVQRDDRFLMVEEETEEGILINQPAGHLEAGESLIDAVIRETNEETAWRFKPSGLVGIYRWPHPKNEITYLRFAFTGDVSEYKPRQELDKGIIRALWMSAGEIEECIERHRSPQVLRCVNDYLQGKFVSLDFLNDVN